MRTTSLDTSGGKRFPRHLLLSSSRGRSLLHKVERTRAAHDAEARLARARARRLREVDLHVVAVTLALRGENSARILPGGDDAAGRYLDVAILPNLALDQQVAGLARRPVLSAEITVLDDARKFPGVALGVAFRRAGQRRLPVPVKTLSRNRSRRQQHQQANHERNYRLHGVSLDQAPQR